MLSIERKQVQRMSDFDTETDLQPRLSTIGRSVKSVAARYGKQVWKAISHNEPEITRHGTQTALNLLIGGRGG